MHRFRLYARNNTDIKSLLDFIDIIRMEFGLNKFANDKFNAGKFVKSTNIIVDLNTI